MTALLQRTTFETSRAAEYFDARELQAQTGQPRHRFATVALKELVDNGLDACETAGVAPEIKIDVSAAGGQLDIAVADNGTGMEPATIERILNFQTRTSDKAAYRAPTRGAQGNALKTVVGIPHALGNGRHPVLIESRGTRHRISAWTDPAGELQVDHGREGSPGRTGTRIQLAIPAAGQEFDAHRWARAFALFNPHALVRIQAAGDAAEHANNGRGEIEDRYHPTVAFPGEWRKFLPTDLTSPWWYDAAALSRLVFSHVNAASAGGRDLTLREFVTQFRGLSGSAKAKQVCERLRGIRRLSDFRERENAVAALLTAMQQVAGKPPSPAVLGLVGEAHFRRCLDAWYGVQRWWYKKVTGDLEGVPFIFEVALAETEPGGALFHGVNFSPTFEDPLAATRLGVEAVNGQGVRGFLANAHALPEEDLAPEGRTKAAAVHIICPALEFLDRGKTRLKVE